MTTRVKVKHLRKEICGWPTDTYEIDPHCSCYEHSSPAQEQQDPLLPARVNPHTVLMFVPGNPGCAGWYVKMLTSVIEQLGEGYAARAVSYAGHGTVPDVVQVEPDVGGKQRDNNSRIAWTLDGQVKHKMHWCNQVMKDFTTRTDDGINSPIAIPLSKRLPPKIVWISHSIGSYLVERLLVLCKKTLLQTQAVIHLMPFRRFDPIPKWKKMYLSAIAHTPNVTPAVLQACSTIAKMLPNNVVDLYLEKVAGVSLLEDRELARGLLCNPYYAKNFITLGMEEIRHVPEKNDVSTTLQFVVALYFTVYIYIHYSSIMTMPTNNASFLECEEYGIDSHWKRLSNLHAILWGTRSMGSKEPHGRIEHGHVAW
jgi:hypothetical protein